METTRILFVCMGNICRSPTAEGVMRRMVTDSNLHQYILIDSAGTHGYHVGEAPDPRAQAAARKRGYDLSALRARKIEMADFTRFDMILGMDFNNLEVLQALCPPENQHKPGLLMVHAENRAASIVHDPYYRSAKDFDLVLDYIEDACRGLLNRLVGGSSMRAREDLASGR
ncbi:low molecular weight protein-tyrosine-phosphatase [Noviherbaspirillum saxi]|uniref:protein-tyrosine-phosphatase n=1 Tax=Noviherbaspirillum saxi TaxID=2320863 RepID=A0A3A3FVU3_9BURK|nr:low molecular weight protein-tyrosine-phosphatase [Noviherbaspirillum saxi]RJF98261.1 low molecular weight phosphotyrosine protein phosphatase [Noviherbaspirillum saxi]